MTPLVVAPAAFDELDRLAGFLLAQSAVWAAQTAPLILGALESLKSHPLTGRPVEHGLRELIISRGRTGYVALYRYDPATDAALLLGVRHQRERGYVD
ncbi:MAG: type II toxin-antitoxin system RelE/ParE family toxin [Betaproteobacteria bacterium]